MENNMIAVNAARYEELLKAEIQRNMLVKVLESAPRYSLDDTLKALFNIELYKQE